MSERRTGDGQIFDHFDPEKHVVPTVDHDGWKHYWSTDGQIIQEWAVDLEGRIYLVAEVNAS